MPEKSIDGTTVDTDFQQLIRRARAPQPEQRLKMFNVLAYFQESVSDAIMCPAPYMFTAEARRKSSALVIFIADDMLNYARRSTWLSP
jgi:hypothetical protein